MSRTLRVAASGALAAGLFLANAVPALALTGTALKQGGEACNWGTDCASGSCVGASYSSMGKCAASAAGGGNAGGQGSLNLYFLKNYAADISNVINRILVPLIFAIAFLVFVWGVFQYFIWGASDSKARETGRQFALAGIIGFVVILSVWGIVYLVMNTLSLSGGSAGSYRLSPPSL